MYDVVHTNASRYTQDEVEDIDIDEDGPPEHGVILHHLLKTVEHVH